MTLRKSIAIVAAIALVILLAAGCGQETKVILVDKISLGSTVILVVEDENGNRYSREYSNTGSWGAPCTYQIGYEFNISLDSDGDYGRWESVN